jgi:hypothetical protein
MNNAWKFAAALLVLLIAMPAGAAVSCEQLAEIALVTERFRDNGVPLADVMLEADRLEASKRFTERDINAVRDTIEVAFKSIRSPNEILSDCRIRSKK